MRLDRTHEAVLAVLCLLSGCDRPTATAVAVVTPDSAPSSAQTSTVPSPAVPVPSASVPDAIIAQHALVIYKGARRAPKSVTRTRTQAKERAQEALAKIRAGASFEEVVQAYSEDTGSAERLGSVGKFRREDMDNAFSSAAFALGVGQVSDVVETPFGFHIIKRTQ